MKSDETKNHGEYVEIASPMQETTVVSERLGGEIWYN